MNKHSMPTTAALIRKAREAKGISQGALAYNLGYSASQNISSWECGDSGVPMTVFKDLCRELSITKKTFLSAVLADYEAKLKRLMN